jgi:hypothetical protein
MAFKTTTVSELTEDEQLELALMESLSSKEPKTTTAAVAATAPTKENEPEEVVDPKEAAELGMYLYLLYPSLGISFDCFIFWIAFFAIKPVLHEEPTSGDITRIQFRLPGKAS